VPQWYGYRSLIFKIKLWFIWVICVFNCQQGPEPPQPLTAASNSFWGYSILKALSGENFPVFHWELIENLDNVQEHQLAQITASTGFLLIDEQIILLTKNHYRPNQRNFIKKYFNANKAIMGADVNITKISFIHEIDLRLIDYFQNLIDHVGDALIAWWPELQEIIPLTKAKFISKLKKFVTLLQKFIVNINSEINVNNQYFAESSDEFFDLKLMANYLIHSWEHPYGLARIEASINDDIYSYWDCVKSKFNIYPRLAISAESWDALDWARKQVEDKI